MKKAYNYIIVGFIAVVLLYALVITFKDIKNNLPNRKESFSEPKVKICLFKATWCSHCKVYVKSQVYNDLFVNGEGKYDGVVFAVFDADKDKAMVEKYDISGFPSIIAVDSNGKFLSSFEGNRNNKEDLVKFVEDNKLKA